MAYLMLSGAENTKLTSGISPSGLGSVGLNFHKRVFYRNDVVSYGYMTPRLDSSITRRRDFGSSSAHGVPLAYVEEAGDPYKAEMEECDVINPCTL
ncbi:hypothetical protein VNO80_16161 [Phaseolus coccineus]|uniref:Uncharacterized protein n=1 Tax=Phaseolus coccineus TaxID=3886 RepID=A0AAN9MLN9_PHACN